MFGIFRKKVKMKMVSPTEQWFIDGGEFLIRHYIQKYEGRNVKKIWLSNLDIVPRGVFYKELAVLIKSPCEYIREYDDIVLFVD